MPVDARVAEQTGPYPTGTVRQYLNTIFLKTGMGGQADLLRLVSR